MKPIKVAVKQSRVAKNGYSVPVDVERESLQIVISGQILGGKNHIMITRTGHRYPVASWAKWREMMGCKSSPATPKNTRSRSVGVHTVYKDIGRDKYPSLKLKLKNARVVFVVNKVLDFRPTLKPTRRHPKQVFI